MSFLFHLDCLLLSRAVHLEVAMLLHSVTPPRLCTAVRQDGSDRHQFQPCSHQLPLAGLRVRHGRVLCCARGGATPSPTLRLASGCLSCRELRARPCTVASVEELLGGLLRAVSSICGQVLTSPSTAAHAAVALYVTRLVIVGHESRYIPRPPPVKPPECLEL